MSGAWNLALELLYLGIKPVGCEPSDFQVNNGSIPRNNVHFLKCFTRVCIKLTIPELSHLVRIRFITLTAFEDILIKVLACINAVAMKVCATAVDTLCGNIFIKPEDINFASGTTN